MTSLVIKNFKINIIKLLKHAQNKMERMAEDMNTSRRIAGNRESN